MKKILLLLALLYAPALAFGAGAGGINLTPNPKALLNSTNTWTAAQTFTSATFTGPITVQNCIGCGSGGGGAGGGASPLAISTGSAVAANTVSSPTATINLDSATFKVQLTGASTAFVQLTDLVPLLTSTPTWTGSPTFKDTATFNAPIVVAGQSSMSVLGLDHTFIGSVSFPSLYFGNSRKTGFYQAGVDNIGLTINGSQLWNTNNSSLNMGSGKPIVLAVGQQGFPTLSFAGNTNTGFRMDNNAHIFMMFNSNELTRFLSSGKVGIGGIQPGWSMHIGTTGATSDLDGLLAVSSPASWNLLDVRGTSTAVRNDLRVSSDVYILNLPSRGTIGTDINGKIVSGAAGGSGSASLQSPATGPYNLNGVGAVILSTGVQISSGNFVIGASTPFNQQTLITAYSSGPTTIFVAFTTGGDKPIFYLDQSSFVVSGSTIYLNGVVVMGLLGGGTNQFVGSIDVVSGGDGGIGGSVNASTYSINGYALASTTYAAHPHLYDGYVFRYSTGAIPANSAITLTASQFIPGASLMAMPICSELEINAVATAGVKIGSVTGLPASFTVKNGNIATIQGYACSAWIKPP